MFRVTTHKFGFFGGDSQSERVELKEPKTRFEECTHFNSIVPLLKELRQKNSEFKKIADKEGVESTEFSKHSVISELLYRFDVYMKPFNKTPPRSYPVENAQDALMLADQLLKETKITVANDESMKTLKAPRNANIENAKDAIKGGTTALAVAVSFASGFGLLFTGTAAMYAYGFGEAVADDVVSMPRSAVIILELDKSLTAIASRLTQHVSLHQPHEELEKDADMRKWGARALSSKKNLPFDLKVAIFSFLHHNAYIANRDLLRKSDDEYAKYSERKSLLK